MATNGTRTLLGCCKHDRDAKSQKRMKLVVGCVTTVVGAIAVWYHNTYILREPSHDWDHERRCFLNRLINSRERDCIEQLRVSRSAFHKLCTTLKQSGGLVGTKHVTVEEAVAMFLHIIAHNLKYRIIQFSYFRSKETISRQFNSVLHAVMRISPAYFKLHQWTLEGSDVDKWKWFQNCLGALDGTHVPVTIPIEDQPRYRNRKGDITTNMLGVCTPDLKFVYVLPGWEGSASDSRVLRDAISRVDQFLIPKDMDEKKENKYKQMDDDKNYIRWSIEMDRSLAGILRDQRSIGNKGNGGWKPTAINIASNLLAVQYERDISKDNVKNRIKTWKRIYGIVSDILSQSGCFHWDAEKNMIIADEDSVWNDYVASHKDAKSFRYKCILNWDDIVDLCGKDRATGEGAETAVDATEKMNKDPIIDLDHVSDTQDTEGLDEMEDTLNSPPSKKKKRAKSPVGKSTSDITVRQPKKRATGKDSLALAVGEMATSLKDYMKSTTQILDASDVCEVIDNVDDLCEEERMKACGWFMENEKQFHLLKAYSAEKKKNFIMLILDKLE